MMSPPSPPSLALVPGAAALLDRPAPPGYPEEWAARLAAPGQERESGTLPVLIFRLGEEWFALPIAVLQEVAASAPFHSLPQRPGTLALGLISVRGELLVCADLAAALSLESAERPAGSPHRGPYLIVQKDGERLALPVEAVAAVHRYHPRELLPLPATLTGPARSFLLGLLRWREHFVGCLEEELLFHRFRRHLA